MKSATAIVSGGMFNIVVWQCLYVIKAKGIGYLHCQHRDGAGHGGPHVPPGRVCEAGYKTTNGNDKGEGEWFLQPPEMRTLMSRWQHSICDSCWEKHNPGRGAHRQVDPKKRICCCCGAENSSGIFIQQDPATLKCGGVHVEPQDDIVPINT